MDRPTEQQFEQWYPQLFRTAYRLTGNSANAADLTQEAILKAWDKWDAFDGKCQPVTWVHRILVNCVLDFIRRGAIRAAVPLHEWEMLAPVADDANPGRIVEHREQLRQLRAEIAALPRELREPFVAAVLDGHAYADVGDMLGIAEGTVGCRVYEARRRIGVAMRKAFSEKQE